MQGVFEGFAVIAVAVAAGALLAHLGIVDEAGSRALSRVVFFVANPALLLVVLADADTSALLTGATTAIVGSAAVTGAVYLLAARLVLRHGPARATVGLLATVYMNAGNLGLPIAAYALGSAAAVTPVLLLQMVVLQPVALAVLDSSSAARRPSLLRALVTPLRNPVTVGALVGVLLAVTGAQLPGLVRAPVDLLAGMAVPAMLLAFGVSLRQGPLPGRGASTGELALITVLKAVVQPLVALVLARHALDLPDAQVLAATVIAALPSAQNVFVIASRYPDVRALVTARDAITTTTAVAGPVVLGAAALLL